MNEEHMMRTRNKPEVLAPAGNLRGLKTAVDYGADAVYCGGKAFGMRSAPRNLSLEDFEEGSRYAHERGARVYVTCNVLPRNAEVEDLKEYLGQLKDTGVDALIVTDIGVMMAARRIAPNLEIHISTQAGVTNYLAANALYELGAKRVVLAREMDLQAVRDIRANIPEDMDIECFVHGAMCISYSGRCLLSNYFTGRDSNRGSCAQSCRWKYALVEETRPGKYFPIEEDERGTYIMNSKDMCLLPHIADVIESGVESLKIEGRMKSVHYVASVTRAYRLAIDAYFEDPEHFQIEQPWLDELGKVSHRPYTTGFYYHQPDADDQLYGTSSYQQTSEFIGLVRSYDPDTQYATVEQRNNMKLGQEIEVFQPNAPLYRQKLSDMLDEEGNPIEVAPHAQQIIKIRMDKPVEPYTILRRDI